MNSMKRMMCLVIVAVLTITGVAYSIEKAGDDQVLAGPKVESEPKHRDGRRMIGFDGRRHRDGRGHGPKIMHLLRELDLDDKQRAQLEDIIATAKAERDVWQDDHAEELAPIREEMKAAREAKDRKRMHEAHQKLRELTGEESQREKIHEQIMSVLTKKQKEALQQQIEKRHQNKGDHGPRIMHRMRGLDLDDKQRAQLGDIIAAAKVERDVWQNDHAEELAPIREEMKAAREAKDRKRMHEAHQKIRELTGGESQREKIHEQIMGVLTEKQKEAWRQRIDERKQGDRKRHDKGRKARARNSDEESDVTSCQPRNRNRRNRKNERSQKSDKEQLDI